MDLKPELKSFWQKSVRSIKRAEGLDDRFDDLIITFTDKTSMRIRGDFSIISYHADNSCMDIDVHSSAETNNMKPESNVIELNNYRKGD